MRKNRKNAPPTPEDPDGPIESRRDVMLRLSADLKKAAREITVGQARYLVDTFYQIQHNRIDVAGQRRAAETANEPVALLDWLLAITTRLEGSIRGALDAYTDLQPVSRWAKGLCGIGPVITAGLAAHIDITKAPTAGAIWRFAGLDPKLKWLGKEGAKKLVEAQWDTGRTPEENALVLAATLGRKADAILRDAGDEKSMTRASVTSAFAKRPWNASLKNLCVHPEASILTRRGPLPIAEVVVGDEVLTHLGRWRRITQIFINEYHGKLFGLISAQAGNQTAWLTEGHPVYTRRVSTWTSGRTFKPNEATRTEWAWEPVENIKPRWTLLRPAVQREPMPIPSINLDGVTIDALHIAAPGRWRSIKHPLAHVLPRETPFTPALMRLLGLYISEGHVSGRYIGWSFHESKGSLIDFVQTTLLNLFGLPTHVSHNLPNHSKQVMVSAKPLADWFLTTIGVGSLTRIPMSWMNLPDDMLRAFWQGIHGDHVGVYAGLRITTANPHLARSLVVLGRRLGENVSLHEEPTRRACRVHINTRSDISVGARTMRTMEYDGPVYNLDVEDDHSYTVEGYAVHNCWKIGESFVKVHHLENDVYGKVYAERKAFEIARNDRGDNRELAAQKLRDKNYGEDTVAKAKLVQGLLPDGQLHERAKRYAVKLFLSHYHEVAYRAHYNRRPPKPYIIEHGGHTHFIEPPQLPEDLRWPPEHP